jgi:signal transduction histidine kinase
MLTRALPVVSLAVVAAMLTPVPASAQPRPERNVLTLHSGAVDYAPNPVLDEGIREALFRTPGQSIDYFTEYLEFDRFSEIEASRAIREYIGRKYAGKRIDVVIAMTMRALRFATDNRDQLFSDAPIVFAAPASDAVIRDAGPRITGVRIGNNYSATMKLALELQPMVKQVFVIAISPNQQNVATVEAELRPFAQQVALTYLQAETVTELLAAVRAVPRGSLILYVWYQRTGDGYVTNALEPARLVSDAARVPVFGVVDAVIGTGVVGGIVRGTRATGTRAGEMARRILDGTPVRNIPIEYAPLLPMFDWRQLQRWHIDPSLLPRGADIQFRVPGVWQTYRWYIIPALAVIAVQSVLTALLLSQHARRRRAERALRAREATLQASNRRIRRLARGLIKAQETVRAEIARDLHDDICQQLVGVSMTVSVLKRSTGAIRDASNQRALAQLERSAQDAVESVRRLSHELHPASLRLLGLASALKGHCLEVEKLHAVHVSFSGAGDVADLPLDVAVCLFRIAQEALRNGIVHGSARRLAVSLARTDAHVDLTVTDGGRGFDAEVIRRDGGGLGLVSIEERVRAVGGAAQIVTRLGHGTTVRVRVPTVAAAPSDTGEVPIPAIPTRLNRAVHSLQGELHRARRLVGASRRLITGSTDDQEPIAAGHSAGRQSKGRL